MAEEAWLRGPIPGVDPLVAPVLFTFTQAREDLARFTDGLTAEQLWSSKAGFHIRHISRSTDRLIAYLEGRMPELLNDDEEERRGKNYWPSSLAVSSGRKRWFVL